MFCTPGKGCAIPQEGFRRLDVSFHPLWDELRFRVHSSIGTGPFKFVSWTRYNETRLVRFENYWETDAEGHNLPYLDEIIGQPKREDSVRLTALRTGQVQLIDSMAKADVERFKKSYS